MVESLTRASVLYSDYHSIEQDSEKDEEEDNEVFVNDGSERDSVADSGATEESRCPLELLQRCLDYDLHDSPLILRKFMISRICESFFYCIDNALNEDTCKLESLFESLCAPEASSASLTDCSNVKRLKPSILNDYPLSPCCESANDHGATDTTVNLNPELSALGSAAPSERYGESPDSTVTLMEARQSILDTAYSRTQSEVNQTIYRFPKRPLNADNFA